MEHITINGVIFEADLYNWLDKEGLLPEYVEATLAHRRKNKLSSSIATAFDTFSWSDSSKGRLFWYNAYERYMGNEHHPKPRVKLTFK